MEVTTVSAITEILINILLGCVSLSTIVWISVGIETLISDRRQKKRDAEREKRDLEYHEKRMSAYDKQ